MLEVSEIVLALDQAIAEIRKLNPKIQVVLTVSPVRYF
ncbi:MAG: GSCFA domain-containing protein, partial [Bacteroidia bacterium]|nr:GSCFA domain-containing protein [Bacteroidia bacterium]